MIGHIFDEIISLENLFSAWYEFKRGKMKKPDVQRFKFSLEDNIFDLHQELKDKTYQHSHYTSFYIKDPKLRHIHKACVKDRVLQHAVFRVLYPIFDKSFIFDSYSCRIKKGTHRAVNRLQYFARKVSKNNTKQCFVLKCDVKKFFNSIDQKVLLGLIKKKVQDKNAVWLIEKIIKSFSIYPNKSLPLGNITSQLFANIYLNQLDQFVKHQLRIRYYIRYCDDFVILSDSKEYLIGLICKISNFLKEELELFLHKDKIEIRKYHQGIDFLGYVSFPYHRIIRNSTKKRMFKNVKAKANQAAQGNIELKSYHQTLWSYLGILKHCNSFKIKKQLMVDVKAIFQGHFREPKKTSK